MPETGVHDGATWLSTIGEIRSWEEVEVLVGPELTWLEDAVDQMRNFLGERPESDEVEHEDDEFDEFDELRDS